MNAITNIRKNRMGTVSFNGKFQGMRKAQDFIVYPMHAGNDASKAQIQSDTRIGSIDLTSGTIMLSPSRSGGSYGVHMILAANVGKLSVEDLFMLKAQIFDTAHGHAGTNGVVYTDNSAALEVFGSKD